MNKVLPSFGGEEEDLPMHGIRMKDKTKINNKESSGGRGRVLTKKEHAGALWRLWSKVADCEGIRISNLHHMGIPSVDHLP